MPGIDETEFALQKQKCENQTNYIKEKFEDFEKKLDKVIEDHENRIRKVEGNKMSIGSIVTAITALATAIGGIIYKMK